MLEPLLVELIGLPVDGRELVVPDYPFDPARGTHVVTIEDNVYIDATDFRMEDSEVRCVVRYVPSQYGVTVLLRYSYLHYSSDGLIWYTFAALLICYDVVAIGLLWSSTKQDSSIEICLQVSRCVLPYSFHSFIHYAPPSALLLMT